MTPIKIDSKSLQGLILDDTSGTLEIVIC